MITKRSDLEDNNVTCPIRPGVELILNMIIVSYLTNPLMPATALTI